MSDSHFFLGSLFCHLERENYPFTIELYQAIQTQDGYVCYSLVTAQNKCA